MALAALVVAAIPDVPAFGIFASDYAGHIKDDPTTDVAFSAKRTEAGTRKVTGFIADRVTFECEADPPGRTDPLRIKGKFPVEHGEFSGTGEAVGIPADPTGKVKGELLPGHKARGSVRLFGELGGMGSDCDTGWQDWRAEKTDF